MTAFAHIAGRCPRPSAAVAIGAIFLLLGLPAAVFALALGFGLLPLPLPLLLILQRLPIAFPLHMIASGLALSLIPIAALARHHRSIHRVLGRMAAVCVVVGGLTALLVALASEASAVARAGFFVQGLVWLATLTTAIVAIRRGDRMRHARLMIAMASVASGAIWLRLVMAGAVVLGWPFEPVYAVAAWICWLIPLAIALTTFSRSSMARPVSPFKPQEGDRSS